MVVTTTTTQDAHPPVDDEEKDAALPEPDLPQHEGAEVRNDEVPADEDDD